MSFSTSERQQNYATFYLNIGIDFKLSGWFYMNAGSGFFYEKSSNSIVLTLNLVPQFKLGNDRMEFYFGFGGLLAINGGPRKGAGYGLLPQLKFNYFFNDKLGIGAEISHPTTFEYFPEFFINVSFCFISRL